MKKIINSIKEHKSLSDIIHIKEKMQDKDSLVGAGIIFMIGGVAVSILSYLYHLFMGRMLGPADYGVLGSLFALIYIATFATTAFNLSVSKFSAEFHGSNKFGEFKSLIRKSLIYVSVVGVILLIIYFLLIPYIAEFMNLDSNSSLFIVGIIAFLSVISAILTGALNGTQKFIWQNVSGFSNAFVKVALAVILVFIGFGVPGALVAILAGFVLGILISIYPLINSFKGIKLEPFNSKKIPRFFLIVFLASTIPVLIITVDQILVKHFFSSSDAGFYAAAGMLAKVIWFGSGFLTGPLFPKVVSLHSQGKNSSRLLFKALMYTGFLVVVGCIAYYIMPTIIVTMLYGESFLPIVPLIGLFGIAMGLFSLCQIMITYNLALEKTSFLWILLFALIIEVAGIFFFHNSLEEVVKILFAVNAFTFISLLFYNRKEIFGL